MRVYVGAVMISRMSLRIWMCLCVGLSAAGIIWCYRLATATHDWTKHVPIGSKLAQLDQLLVRHKDTLGRVYSSENSENGEQARYSPSSLDYAKAGKFLGDYDTWLKSMPNLETFSGTIEFVRHGFTSSDVAALSYRGGRLVKREWGFLPG